MTEYSFSLVPFPAPQLPDISIKGRITRDRNLLTVHYSLSGKLEEIRFPEPARQPARRDELWLATCFEFFLAVPDQPEYYEFNLSASGDWNAFCMDAYRRVGFRHEERIQDLQLRIKLITNCFTLDGIVDISPLFHKETPIQAGITSVIQTSDGNETYWALAHPNPRADFHLRESFILVLEGEGHPSSPPSPTGSRPARIHKP